jgi:HSP20 family protein
MFDTILSHEIRQTLDDFRRSVDRLFPDVYGSQPVNRSEQVFTPAVESASTDDELMLRAILPGVAEQDVKVTVQNGRLVIEGERKAPEGWGDNTWTKIAYGRFYTEIPIPNGLDLDKVRCQLHDGVLDIVLPISEAVKPRQIPIEPGDSAKAIPASV